jgi:hypothetical protein
MNKDILLRVSVLEEVWDAPAFAVVRLDQTLARHYIELIQQAQELGQQYRVFDALSLFDYTPVWYEYIEALDRSCRATAASGPSLLRGSWPS